MVVVLIPTAPVQTIEGFQVRRLSSIDHDAFMAIRSIGLQHEPERYRSSLADDVRQGSDYWRKRLDGDRVFGVFDNEQLIAIGGLSQFVGEKLQHKGLIWGMYVAPAFRGSQVSHLLMEALLESAVGYVTHLQLTLMADNLRARAYYERYGFKLYAIEPFSVMTPTGPADEALMWRLVEPTETRNG